MKNFNKYIYSANLFKISFTFLFAFVISSLFLLSNANAQEEDENEFDYGRYVAGVNGLHSGYVQSDGSLFMWGDNREGALGIKTYEEGGADEVTTPRFVLKNVKFVDGGRDFFYLEGTSSKNTQIAGVFEALSKLSNNLSLLCK